MTLFLSIVAILFLLALWSLAWRKRPMLAYGIFLGTVSGVLLAVLFRSLDIQHIPIWLPALPFAVVAVALLYFGILAWWWGRNRQS